MNRKIIVAMLLGVIGLVNGRGENHDPRFLDCKSGQRFPYSYVCDGEADCDGSDDEISASNFTEAFDPFGEWQRCSNPKQSNFNGQCLARRDDICDGRALCSNVSPCDLKCESHYRCQDGNCFLRTTVCDHDPCSGCEEDHGWTTGVGFKCSRGGNQCVLPQQLLHDDISDCDGGADLCFRNANESSRNERQPLESLNREMCFQCMDGSMIISSSNVCDKVIDCPDLSDECLCTNEQPEICGQIVTDRASDSLPQSENISKTVECEAGAVRCKNGKCIARQSVCDGVKDCDEDESFDICRGTIACKDATKVEGCRCSLDREQSSCRSNTGTSCDGLNDCPPLQISGWQTWTLESFPEDECNKTCAEGPANFTCEETQSRHYKKTLSGTWCELPEDRENLPNEYTQSIEGKYYCDGIVDCELTGSDENECLGEYYRFYCNATRPGYVNIAKQQVCDGVLDCTDGLDELAETCEGEKDKRKFTCPVLNGTKVSIDIKNRCDFIINCDDASDEMNCSENERFYCENKKPLFVRISRVKDGIGDCDDWSDECPTLNGSTVQDAFSSRYEMLSNPILSGLVWIMGLTAIVGNTTVIIRELHKMRRSKKKSTPAMRANRFLISNLAIADLLMGIYLIVIGSMTVKMKGNYCSKDLGWRTSSTCVGLGVLSVLSSETSVITLVILTGCRLYAVFKPLQSSFQPSYRRVVFLISASWLTSLVLALLPLASVLSYYFVASVEFKYNPFVSGVSISLPSAKKLFRNMATVGTVNQSSDVDTFLATATWERLEQRSFELFSFNYFEPQRYWGYYSASSVCIPKFFITTSDPAWVYSFIVTLFNFFAFTFVASAYLLIYLKSRRNAELRNMQENDKRHMKAMQRKIFRLITTDFCCWIPICIMAFIKLSGVDVPDTAYAVSAVVLLPLNSALNPLLYSSIAETVIEKCRRKKKDAISSSENNACSWKSTQCTKTRMCDISREGTPDSARKIVIHETK